MHILIAAAGAALLALIAWVHQRGRDRSAMEPAPASTAALMAVILVLVSIIIRLMHLSILYRSGFLASEVDEPIRWAISVNWSKRPFFFTDWDGIWLSGGFAYYGLFIKLVGDPVRGMQAGNLIAQMFTLGSIAFAGATLCGRPLQGALGALLACIGFQFIHIGMGPLAEGLLGGAVCFTAAAAVRFLRSGSAPPARRLAWAAATALGLFVVASLHYNGWIAIICGGPFFLAAFWARRGALGRAGRIGLALIVIGAAAFPLGWIIQSARILGSPFAFFENQVKMNTAQMPAYTDGKTEPFWVYPRLYFIQAGALIPLLILAALPGSGAARQVHRERLVVVILVGGFLLLTSIRAKLSGFYPSFHRYVFVPYALSFPLAGAALGLLPSLSSLRSEASRRFHWNRIAPAALLIGALAFSYGWVRQNLSRTRDPEKHVAARAWDHMTFALATWLQQELTDPQILGRGEVRRPIGFHSTQFGPELLNIVAFYSDRRDVLRLIPAQNWPAAASNFGVAISNAPEIPAGFTQIMNIGPWHVMRRAREQAN